MKKAFLLCSLFLAALFVTSCTIDDVPRECETPVVENGFLMQLSVQGNGTVGTRVTTLPALPGESDVHSLHLLFFNTSAPGTFAGYIDASPQAVYAGGYYVLPEPLNMSTPIRIDFTDTGLNADTDYRILVVANMYNYTLYMPNWLASFVGTTFSEAQARLVELIDMQAISGEELLMTSSITRRGGQPMIHTSLVRALVRFDVMMNVDPVRFVLERVELWNVPIATALWNSDFNDFRAHTEYFSSVNVMPGQEHKGVIFGFENSVTGSYMGDTFTTCLILRIRDNDRGRSTYYRVNVNEQGAQLLRRNHVYQVTIHHIHGLGENTARDAWAAAVTMLDTDVRHWQDGGHGGVMFDGEDILAIGANRIDFDADGDGGNGREEPVNVTIFTFSPDASNILRITDGTNNGTLLVGDGTNGLPTGITAQLNGNILSVTATATNIARDGFIELTFGTMRGVVHVVQSDQHTLFLDLSVGTTELPAFGRDGGEISQLIEVTSSHAWTAQLHNNSPAPDQQFSFYPFISTALETVSSPTANGSFRLSSLTDRTLPQSHYAFVIVRLTDHPNVNRVLVLRQEGSSDMRLGDLTLANLVFNPMGQTINGNVPSQPYYFDVPILGTDPWVYNISGPGMDAFRVVSRTAIDGHPNHYTLRVRVYNDAMTGTVNPEMQERAATLSAFLTIDPSTRVNINLRQQAHSISLSPAAITTPVPPAGGTVSLTVTSSYPNWEIRSVEVSPELENHTVTATRAGNVVNVVFSQIHNLLAGTVATVTVGIPGTNVTASIAIPQGQRQLQPVYILTARATHWGTWSPLGGTTANRNGFGRLRDELASTANFGLTGTVLSGERMFSTRTGGGTAGLLPDSNVQVFLSNSTQMSSAQGAQVRAWLAGDTRRVLVVVNERPSSSSTTGLRNLLGAPWVGHSQGTRAERRIATPHISTNNPAIQANNVALYQYLFMNGPFSSAPATTSVSTNVVVRSRNSNGGTLSAWSPTFVPIIFHPGTGTNRAVVGIDPVQRIVYVGEPELFGRGSRTNTNWGNPANVEFVRNLAAWIINTTQHGEDFTSQFH